MQFKIATLLLLCSPLLHAGEHYEKFDDFTGETKKGFITTDREAKYNRAYYLIGEYNKNRNTVTFIVQAISGATSCNKQYLLLKDNAGVLHKLDADEKGFNKCIVFNLDADLVRKPFKVRIPMHSGANLDIDVDTTALDLSKL